MTAIITDWTQGPDGRSNTSAQFEYLCGEVEQLIRHDAHRLLAGRADMTAGLIMAQLAHKYGLRPIGNIIVGNTVLEKTDE